jgi:hypothetical protein
MNNIYQWVLRVYCDDNMRLFINHQYGQVRKLSKSRSKCSFPIFATLQGFIRSLWLFIEVRRS